MKSSVAKRSIVIDGHKTSVSLEDAFWNDLRKIARARRLTLSELVAKIDASRDHGNLSSALRLFVLHSFQSEKNEQARAVDAVGVDGKRRLRGLPADALNAPRP